MRFRKEILLSLLTLLSFSVVKAQKPKVSPTPVVIEDEAIICCPTELLIMNFSVRNSKASVIKDLTNGDFEFYYKTEKLEVEFFKFDELKNQYSMGFLPDMCFQHYEGKGFRIKVKLSKEKKNQYGKVFVKMKTEK